MNLAPTKCCSTLSNITLSFLLFFICLSVNGAGVNITKETWVQRYDLSSQGAYPKALAIDRDENVIVTGDTFQGRVTDVDFYTAKYSKSDGTILWEKYYDGFRGDDYAFASAIDPQGNVIVTGASYGPNESFEFYTVKYRASDGNIVWERRYAGIGSGDDFPTAVASDSLGNIVVTGYSNNGTNDDFYTAKYAEADGHLLWEARYNSSSDGEDQSYALALDRNDDVVVTGSSDGRFQTIKYSGQGGSVMWTAPYNNAEHTDDVPRALGIDQNGDVIVTGASKGTNDYDFYTAKYSGTNGLLLWAKIYNGPENADDQPTAMALDAEGNVFVTGSSANADAYDFFTIKYSASGGDKLWEKRFHAPGGYDSEAQAVVVDRKGDCIVAGYSLSAGTGFDFLTIKYQGPDGTPVWETHYDSSDNQNDFIPNSHCLAVGPGGLIAVTGQSKLAGLPYGYATVAYREYLPTINIRIVGAIMQLQFTGEPGKGYQFQKAVEASGPWKSFIEKVASSDGSIQVEQPFDSSEQNFYRVSQQ